MTLLTPARSMNRRARRQVLDCRSPRRCRVGRAPCRFKVPGRDPGIVEAAHERENIEHRTLNAECSLRRAIRSSMFGYGSESKSR